MLFVFIAPLALVALALAVPIWYRRVFPLKPKRPKVFLGITVATSLIVAIIATVWFLQIFAGVGFAHATPERASYSQAVLEATLLKRFLIAAIFTVLGGYLACRITHVFLGTDR
jgi:hypothetical protein